MISILKRIFWPHGAIILLMLTINTLFFYPLYFEGKSLFQHDILQGLASNNSLREIMNETGEYPLWSNNMFSGMPAYLIYMKFPSDLADVIVTFFNNVFKSPSQYTFLALISYYIMLLAFGVRPLLAFAGAITFAYTSFNIIGLSAGHNAKIGAVAFMPLVLAGTHLIFSKKYWLGLLTLALGLSIQLKINHLQITYYLLIILLFYGISQLIFSIKNQQIHIFIKSSAIALFGVILAISMNMGRILTLLEYSPYSIRGKSEIKTNEKNLGQSGLDKDYAFEFSNGIFEPLVVFVPNILGGSTVQPLSEQSNLAEALKKNGLGKQQIKQQLQSVPTYWGEQRLTAPYYIGAGIILLFSIGMVFLTWPMRSWLLATIAVGIILSWGDNASAINYFIFDYLPGYNKFRSVTFAIIMVAFAIPIAGMMGLESLLANDKKIEVKKIFWAIGIPSGFLIVLILFSGMLSFKGAIDEQLANYPQWFLDALRADRKSLLISDALRSLFFVLGVSAVVWFWFKQKLSEVYALILLVVLLSIDIFSKTRGYLTDSNYKKNPYEAYFKPTPADAIVLQDQSDYRVLQLNNPFNDARTSYFHQSIGGYHGAKMKRYQDIISTYLEPQRIQAIDSLRSGNSNFTDLEVINMLNTKYLIGGNASNLVFKNESAKGNAWLPEKIINVQNPQDAFDGLKDLQPNEAIIENASTNSGIGTLMLKKRETNKIIYEANIQNGGLAVFSEIYYPKGWIATANNTELPIYCANYLLRAVDLPEGKYEVTFTFKPQSYQLGSFVTTFGSAVYIVFLIGFLIYSYINRAKQKENNP